MPWLSFAPTTREPGYFEINRDARIFAPFADSYPLVLSSTTESGTIYSGSLLRIHPRHATLRNQVRADTRSHLSDRVLSAEGV